jgi:hypothetical protein
MLRQPGTPPPAQRIRCHRRDLRKRPSSGEEGEDEHFVYLYLVYSKALTEMECAWGLKIDSHMGSPNM